MTTRKKPTAGLPALPEISIPENIGEFLTQYKENLPNDEQVLWDGVNQSMKVELFSYIDSGIKLKKLKEISEHGTFTQRLKEYEIQPRNAQTRIAIATRFCELEKFKYDLGSHLGVSKIRELIKWEDEEINNFFDGEEVKGLTFEEAKTMSTREFVATIKDAQFENTDLNNQLLETQDDLEDAQEQIDALKKQLAGKSQLNEWPDIINLVRDESTALSTQSLRCLDDIERVLIELQDEGNIDIHQYNIAYTSLFHNANAITARAVEITQKIKSLYEGERDLELDENITQLSEAEIQKAVTRRRVLTREHDQARLVREQQREAQKAPRRGRPKKIGGES